MRSFTDNEGRVWQISVTLRTVKRVRQATGVLITGIFESGPESFSELGRDLVKLVDTLWITCEQQAKELGVSENDFAEALAGDSFGAAGEALARAVADFFPSPDKRAAAHQAMDKLNLLDRAMTAEAANRISQQDDAQLAKNYMDYALNSLGSRASIRGTTPSEN